MSASIKTGQSLSPRAVFRILSLSAVLYVLLYYTCCCLKYYGFIYDDFDFAIHDQIIWNILHGRIFNSILGIDFLGNHANFVSFLIAPLYAFFPHPLFLLLLQTVFLAAGAFPLYALARLHLDQKTSLFVGVIYLLYSGLGYTNLYEFHPVALVPFFLLCAAYYFFKDRFFYFNIFMLLSLSCQENIALIFIMWGIYALILRKSWKWVWWPAGLGMLYFLFCVYVVLPGFNKSTFNFFHIYGPLGGSLNKVVATCLRHPLKVLGLMFQPHKIAYLKQLFVSLLFVPLFSPLALLPAFLIFVQHLLSFRTSEVSLHFHYTAELIPFIFIAFIFGAKKITASGTRFRLLGDILLLNALIFRLTLGPPLHLLDYWKHLHAGISVVQKEKLVQQIPKNAPVVATFEFLSHLSHRQELYSFHHVYSGFYTLFTKRYRLPDNVQYALIDFNDDLTFFGFYGPKNYLNLEAFLKQGAWGVMEVKDSVVLFKKGVKSRFPLFDFLDSPVAMAHPVRWIIDKRIELYGYDIQKQPEGLDVIFYWKLLRPEQKDVNLFFDFIDPQGRIFARQLRPVCYKIWPTQAWVSGKIIKEHQYISLSRELLERLRGLKIGAYEFTTGSLVATDSRDALGRIDLDIVHLRTER